MTQEPTEDSDDLRLQAMLRTIDADAALPDRGRLEALRQQLSDVFVDSATLNAGLDGAGDTKTQAVQHSSPLSPITVHPIPVVPVPTRRVPMFSLAMRGAVAAAMSVLVLVTWFFSNNLGTANAATVPFSKVLEELRGASTLELQLTKDGTESQILVRAPGLVRKEQSATRYEIAAGSRLWKVDESANTISEEESPWFLGPAKQVDLLGLLDVGVTDASSLLRARPVEQATSPWNESTEDASPDQRLTKRTSHQSTKKSQPEKCLVYRADLPAKSGQIQVEVFVNQKDRRLVGVFAWPAGAKRHAGPPLAEMRLIAMNETVADEKFQVTNSLTEDGRIGKVTQSQGIVGLRPMLAKRWTPISQETLLKPGDWLRTELRGANAVKVSLSSDVELTLGPGTLVEMISPTKARVHQGLVQVKFESFPKQPGKSDAVKADPIGEFTLLAPREGSRKFNAGVKQLVRVDRDEKLVDVPATPVWLAGFEGTTNNESIGSLIVNLPDGRNEPLTVGYHKVSVEIRDQIARTTIEESFVNRTVSRLEGVFHFPLPQDASISGFGMWIGNELIEADVVEKQRAREIYETILRERRDPGLLEWTGGNIFKARVFPIEPHSEKRIKIVYTQVLPLKGNRYRYGYGLRSELLRTSPLRELSMTVTVNSALALKSVTCPTHTVRSQQTAHSAQVEFVAQEYTPTRDFEVVCEVDQQQSDVVVVPHRRGDDGYFLVQITPPFNRDGGARLNEVIPDGNPLNIVFLCDTSASMDSEKRRQQTDFVNTVLSSLGPDDRYRIAACDVGTVWASETALSPSAGNIAASIKFLNERVSLGWTNLDRAFDDVLKKAIQGTQIVYIGDGIVSSGDTDPAAFVQRLGERFKTVGQTNNGGDNNGAAKPIPLAFHAVTVGNSYESIVLNGIASVGSGSVRTIGGEQTPSVVAREWLTEVAQPGLRDVNVEFRGIKVAAVYPGRLPNVPVGTQQILVGRYLPELASGGKVDQQGEVIVTGLRGKERVKFAARISFKDAEDGNSFIPRLWGRAHLDHLLAQGPSSLIHDEIIRLSEEFHIITPFTSLLVLETDADRERFGVQRRYEMRDGERFFTAGRDNSNYELLQQQMKRAGDWRIGIRRQVLQSLSGLGRDPRIFQQVPQTDVGLASPRNYLFSSNSTSGLFLGDKPGLGVSGSMGTPLGRRGAFGGGMGGFAGRSELDGFDFRGFVPADGAFEMDGDFDSFSQVSDFRDNGAKMKLGVLSETSPFDEAPAPRASFPLSFDGTINDFEDSISLGLKDAIPLYDDNALGGRPNFRNANRIREASLDLGIEPQLTGFVSKLRKSTIDRIDSDWTEIIGNPGLKSESFGKPKSSSWSYSRRLGRSIQQQPDYTSWINSLFPSLEPKPAKRPLMTKEPEMWSPESIQLAKRLLRTESLLKLEGGIELRRRVESIDPRWNRSTGRNIDLALYSPTAWLTTSLNPSRQTLVNYCDLNERGIYSKAFLLGRNRESVASELKLPPLGLADFSLSPLFQMYSGYNARIEPDGDNRVALILTNKDSTSLIRFTIDTARHVVLNRTTQYEGKLVDQITYSGFVEAAGSWWATKVVSSDEQGRPTTDTLLEIDVLTKEKFAERMGIELAAKPTVQFIHYPTVPLPVARQKAVDGSAAFDDRLTMIMYKAQLQQWDEMWKHVDAIEKLAPDKPGIRWIRTILLATIRRNEEAMQRLMAEAARLAAAPTQDEFSLAEYILGHANSLVSGPEFYPLHQSLKPVYSRPFSLRLPALMKFKEVTEPADLRASETIQSQLMLSWYDREIASLENLGRFEEALEVRRVMATSNPWDSYRQEAYAQLLARAGQFATAHAWLRQELKRPERNMSEVESLRTAIADLYHTQVDWAGLLEWTSDWIEKNPESGSYYSAYSRHLSAMIFNDQLDGAYALADQWLKDARVEGKMSAVQRARFDTAINFANGQLYQVNFQRMEERWFEPMAETARFFVRHPHHFDVVQRCVSNQYFGQSDVSDQLRGEWLTMLQTEFATLNSTQISTLVGWTLSGRMQLTKPINGRKQLDASEVPSEIWKSIADELKVRWLATNDHAERHLLGETLRSIYANRFGETELLPFLRERIAVADAVHKGGYVSSLCEALLATRWTEEIEAEAFSVWRELSAQAAPVDRMSVEMTSLMRLVDAMLVIRIGVEERQLGDQGAQDKLTRKELALKKAEIRKSARIGLSARLAQEAAKEMPVVAEPGNPNGVDEKIPRLRVWLLMEQYWLQLLVDQNVANVEAECWKILGEIPVAPVLKAADDSQEDVSEESLLLEVLQTQREFFEMVVRQRAFTMVMSLTTRKQASPESVERLLKYVDAGIDLGIAQTTKEDSSIVQDYTAFWRMTKFRLLVALDRPEQLEKELREWIRAEVSTGPWRQSLARILAEQGKLDEAIQLFEACKRDHLLSSADFQLMADWNLVVNRRDAYDRSRIEAFLQMPEGNLAQFLHLAQNRWQQTNVPLPSELDENTLFAFKALLKKSAQPENYLWQLRNLYAASRDFRLLQMLPDAVLGRSPQQAYAFFQSLQNQVLYELRNEATADEILTRVNQLRKGELTSTDLRALDILEAFVERRSSEILNQPGPHIDACLAALQRAFQRTWTEGEPLMMSEFLQRMGAFTNDRLKAEQIREIRSLILMTPAGSRDHLKMTSNLCQLLFWNYSLQDEGLQTQEAEYQSYLQANEGIWPHADNEYLSRYAQMLEGANRHAAGEAVLKKQIARPANDEQRKWLNDLLMSLYNHALEHDGAVSIGTGRVNLLKPIVDLTIQEILASPDESVRYHLVSRLNTTFDIAQRHKLSANVETVTKFAFETIPQLLKKQQSQYRNTVSTILQSISSVLEPKVAMRFVVERMEQWPQRLEIQWDNSWNTLGSQLAHYRKAIGTTDLDDRVLKLAVAQLQRDLRRGEGGQQQIYHSGNGFFWAEKTQDFAKAAEVILNERRASGRRAMVVADYLRNGLQLAPRAIEILLIAHGNGLLNESEQFQLVSWLHETNRYAEMIPILDQLVIAHPDNITYRTELMAAYFHSQRPEQLRRLIEQTDSHFHQDGRWTEANIAQFARGCQSTQEWEKVNSYFTEAIALHQRSNPTSGVNDNILSSYYQGVALGESSLHHTEAAVTAASSAIICWDARHQEKKNTMGTLRSVLHNALDLDAYVHKMDLEATKTGQDSPILRKAIGETYQAKNEQAKAIEQFKIAIELQPNDKETHQALIACYDATQNKAAATNQLLKLIDLQRHDLTLYQQLASQMKDDEAEAERAATSIIESAPNESESHSAMAELRQNQNRWSEAIPHWEHVVKLRKLEPTGLLKLAAAQVHEQKWEAAKESLRKLKRTEWPSRFNNVTHEIYQLEQGLPK